MALVQRKPETATLDLTRWQWVQELIDDVASDRTKERIAQRYFEWEFSKRQFRKLEFQTVLTHSPGKEVLRLHAVALDRLIQIAQELRTDYRTAASDQLARLHIEPNSLDASIQNLRLSLDYCHHNVPESEVTAAAERVFGRAAPSRNC